MCKDTPTKGKEPITCEQHDYLEIACMFGLIITVEMIEGEDRVLTPKDTQITNDKVEWLVGLEYPNRTEIKIRTDSIASIRALNPNPYFDTVVFKPQQPTSVGHGSHVITCTKTDIP